MISRVISQLPRFNITKIAAPLTTRTISTHGVEAVEKLKGALEDYRMQKYVKIITAIKSFPKVL
jgi:hypothetical protein